MTAHTDSASSSVTTLRATSTFSGNGVSVYLRPSLDTKVALVEVGYTFRILGEERDCHLVEMNSGKVGYVSKKNLVSKASYMQKYKDEYPPGTHAVRNAGFTGYHVFVVDNYLDGIFVYGRPDSASRRFILCPWRPFRSQKHSGGGIELSCRVSPRVTSPATRAAGANGHRPVNRISASTVSGRTMTDDWFLSETLHYHSDTLVKLDSYRRLPVVEEWDNWFRVQLPDGSLGFAPEGFEIRAIAPETLVDTPKEGSTGALGGLLRS